MNMENKFDRINHSFMYRVLEKFGFNIQFTRKIKACISKLHIAPLVNERPAIFFQLTQGIKKGCLLSPFLYILIVESLRRKFHMEMAVGNLLGIKMTQGVDPINESFFPDDSLFLMVASINIAKSFKRILHSSCAARGRKITFKQSVIYCCNMEQMELTRITCMMGLQCFDKWESFKYLGVPISSRTHKENHWKEADNKIKSKISSLVGCWLNHLGKLVIMNCTLFSIPIYQAFTLLAPKSFFR